MVPNIAKIYLEAVASNSVVWAILQNIQLGKYRTEIGLEVCQALFVNMCFLVKLGITLKIQTLLS